MQHIFSTFLFCAALGAVHADGMLVSSGEDKAPAAPYPIFGNLTLTPSFELHDLTHYGFSNHIINSTLSSSAVWSGTILSGLGLSPELSLKDVFRMRGHASILGGQSPLAIAMMRGLFFESDLQLTCFSPMNSYMYFLITGGWEYHWGLITRELQGGNGTYTESITRMNGPFGGFGVQIVPSASWKIESGINYHAPMGSAHIRGLLNNAPDPSVWLNKVRYRSSRFGISGYLSGRWSYSEHFGVKLGIEARTLSAKGDHVGEVDGSAAETRRNTMLMTSINYNFAFDYMF